VWPKMFAQLNFLFATVKLYPKYIIWYNSCV
jgi:hypothetical protein